MKNYLANMLAKTLACFGLLMVMAIAAPAAAQTVVNVPGDAANLADPGAFGPAGGSKNFNADSQYIINLHQDDATLRGNVVNLSFAGGVEMQLNGVGSSPVTIGQAAGADIAYGGIFTVDFNNPGDKFVLNNLVFNNATAKGANNTMGGYGGFLYLQKELRDKNGCAWPMAGALPGAGFPVGRPVRFGYSTLVAQVDSLLAETGDTIGAHEFHYWDSEVLGDGFLARKAGDGSECSCIVAGSTVHAGFPHLYFWSNPEFARRFVGAAGKFLFREKSGLEGNE